MLLFRFVFEVPLVSSSLIFGYASSYFKWWDDKIAMESKDKIISRITDNGESEIRRRSKNLFL